MWTAKCKLVIIDSFLSLQVLSLDNDVEKGSDMVKHLAKIRSVSEGGSESNHSDVSSDSDLGELIKHMHY